MFRSVFTRILKHGRQIVGEVLQKQAPKETKDVIRIGLENQPRFPTVTPPTAKLQGFKDGESILSRYLARSVTRSLAAEMRNKFALRTPAGSWNVFGGARLQANRLSLYAFVGIGLAANTRWRDREAEGFDTVCDQIRGMFKTRPTDTQDSDVGDIVPGHTLEDFEIGSLIAKGCNAAVYRARLRNTGCVEEEETLAEENTVATPIEETEEEGSAISGESDSHTTSQTEVDPQSSPLDLEPTLEPDTQSRASSIEVLMEDDLACVTSFDPGGSAHDLRWRFEIVPLEGDTGLVNDTGWTDGEKDESIEIISEVDIELSGIPDMQDLEPSKEDVGENRTGVAENQGMILLGEWDIRLEDAVNLSVENGTGLNSLSVTNLAEGTAEGLQPSNTNNTELTSDSNPESRQIPQPPAGLEVILDPPDHTTSGLQPTLEVDTDYNLAIKMMFNYDAESNAPSILRTMAKELVPARLTSLGQSDDMVEISHKWKACHLPPHPYIVDMQGVFVDWFPYLPDAWDEYPDAMPERLNPGRGCGRNQTMFLVMKRYPVTLREYLENNTPTVEEGCRLLTQLVEAVAHMNQHGIAHRDMKSDNILLNFTHDGPSLVVSDFGCCTTEGLRIPYTTWEVDRGGNGSLMAPEISTATPGLFRHLDYSKADLWAVGAIAYEIFGCDNPFYRNRDGWKLDSRTYSEQDLPQLPDGVPNHIQDVVQMMLTKDLTTRPAASLVANMLHLVQWAPKEWLPNMETSMSPPSSLEVKRWLLTLTAEVMCQQLGQGQGQGQSVEHQLKRLFLSRVDLDDVMSALIEL